MRTRGLSSTPRSASRAAASTSTAAGSKAASKSAGKKPTSQVDFSDKPLSQTTFKVGDSSTKVGSQVKYGPTADLSQAQQDRLTTHYLPQNKKGVLERLTQYNAKHSTYVNAAEASGRPLTPQELAAKKSGANTPNASINHVIASGTGQNLLNHETLHFQQGAQKTQQGLAELRHSQPHSAQEALAQKKVAHGLAQQSAAVGRQQGYSRATLEERRGELSHAEVDRQRTQAMKNTLTAMQGAPAERFPAYKSVLKDTFDAPGNLRVGNGLQNTKISTGFDAPLDARGRPTPRAERLHHAHQTYAPDRLLENNRVFTKDSHGTAMSSSMEVPELGKGKRPATFDDVGSSKRPKTE